jgi:hypothetical protein
MLALHPSSTWFAHDMHDPSVLDDVFEGFLRAYMHSHNDGTVCLHAGRLSVLV